MKANKVNISNMASRMEVDKLLDILKSIEDLLRKSNHDDKAEWLADKGATINDGSRDKMLDALESIRGHMVGMGSLTDLYLRPIPETGMTPEEARGVLLGLVESLYNEIVSILAGISLEDDG